MGVGGKHKWTSPDGSRFKPVMGNYEYEDFRLSIAQYCPYGKIGDRLWVRHTFYEAYKNAYNYQVWDEFTNTIRWRNKEREEIKDVSIWEHNGLKEFDKAIWKKRPSIFMPRWASRITLEITDIRVERVQNISESDSEAEGCDGVPCYHGSMSDCGGVMACSDCYNTGWLEPPTQQFYELWNSIHGKEAWERNDWVWVISFKKINGGGRGNEQRKRD